MRAAILTAGCRLNQSESDALRAMLLRQGVAVVADPAQADVCYVNTCTVTGAADRSSMQLVRRAARSGARLVVMGCLVERDQDRVKDIEGVSDVWGNADKERRLARFGPSPERSRALLKVQDGCDRDCAYCVVSGLRGAPASVPASEVEKRFLSLVDDGFREVVLTGLNLGLYNDGGIGLAGLVRRLLDSDGRARVRLGSVEPDTADRRLLDVLREPRVCPHLHLPMQTGDDRLLGRMGRRYSTGRFAELVRQTRKARPDVNIGVDVIAGLPGEDDASFRRTEDLVRSLRPGYLHAFSFSPRPGTRAASMDRVPSAATRRLRVSRLREVSVRLREEYESRYVGSVRRAVVETRSAALTDNYMRLRLRCDRAPKPRSLVDVQVVNGKDGGREGVVTAFSR
ncbi:MAG: radical SAM protein [candidate division WOR-3 bacterium]|nr:MAG: radical SAM protein [candidate division WOR-3 bacterium]